MTMFLQFLFNGIKVQTKVFDVLFPIRLSLIVKYTVAIKKYVRVFRNTKSAMLTVLYFFENKLQIVTRNLNFD